MVDLSTITDSFELVVRDAEGKVKSYRYVSNGWEFIPNERYIAALNEGSKHWHIPLLYGTWRPSN